MDAAGVLIDQCCTHAFLSVLVSVSPFDCEERMCLHEWASDMETSPCYRGGCVQEQTGSTELFVQHTPRLPGCLMPTQSICGLCAAAESPFSRPTNPLCLGVRAVSSSSALGLTDHEQGAWRQDITIGKPQTIKDTCVLMRTIV